MINVAEALSDNAYDVRGGVNRNKRKKLGKLLTRGEGGTVGSHGLYVALKGTVHKKFLSA